MRLLTLASIATVGTTLAACGATKNPEESASPEVKLQVSDVKLTPKTQLLGDQGTLSLTIKNTGENPAPLLAVTLGGTNDVDEFDPADEGRRFEGKDNVPTGTKRAPWFVDDGPGGSSLSEGNTWVGGRLEPGQTRTLKWSLNSQQPGDHELTYDVVSGLTDSQANATTGTGLSGTLKATITANSDS